MTSSLPHCLPGRRSFAIGMLACTVLAWSPSVAAQPVHRGAELEAYGGVLIPNEPSLAAGEQLDISTGVLFGGRIGYLFRSGLFFQADAGYAPLDMNRGSGDEQLNLFLLGASLGYSFDLGESAQFFLLGGGGVGQWIPKQLGSEVDVQAQFGGGIRYFLGRSVALRFEARDHWMPDGLSATRRKLDPSVPAEATRVSSHQFELSAGISLLVGGRRDSDDDGVANVRDACPDTPLGARVDERGCPLDGDGDGVADFQDRCPDTPPGARVDARGCPMDGDGDGVPDGIDRCPDTPAGARVDARGCTSDGDGDGVPDGIDRCPDTPTGQPVDTRGCATDADGDGVQDASDACPNTEQGVRVDERGCPLTAVERALVEEGRLVLRSVHFEFNQATLRPESAAILDEVGQALLRNPEIRVEIQGHTDAVGDAAYNQRLSELRAAAVRDYLLGRFPELQPDRLTARGYGESRPVASNRTEEGRQQNRRVEFVVLGG